MIPSARRFGLFLPLFLTCGLVAFTGLALPAQAQDIQVTSADPNTAPQATVNLNVLVKGKGFKKGAVAKWQVTGTEDPGGVTVNSTTFVNSTELVANIDVAETAVISLYDIKVRNSDGRIGKGTELFRVTEKGSGSAGSSSCPQPTPVLTGATSCAPGSTLPGCLDASFGSGGVVRTDTSGPFPIATDIDIAKDVAIQPDGKIVVDGSSRKADNSGDETVLVRYNPDGSLDPSFGTGGIARLGMHSAEDMALQPDGKIVMAGFGFSVVRLNSNGSLDTSFGSGGITSVTFGSKRNSGGIAFAVAVQGDGKILAAGDSGGKITVVRLNQDGSLDSTFGSGGKVVTATFGRAWAIALQTVGGSQRILVGGSGVSSPGGGGDDDFAILRFTMSGALDTSFGPSQNGRVLKNVCGTDRIKRLGVDAAGNIVAAGMVPIGEAAFGFPNWNPTLARFTASGLPDNAFGDGVAQRPGTALVDVLGGYDSYWGFAIQADGKILMSGRAESSDGAAAYVYVARFNPNGTLDTTFGAGGAVAADVRSGSGARDNYGQRLALQSDGKIVVVGSTAANNTFNFVVVRLWH